MSSLRSRTARVSATKKAVKAPAIKKATFETYPLVVVNWQDASFGSPGWTSEAEFKPPLLEAQTVGYLVFQGKNEWGIELITIAASVVFQETGKPHFSDSFSIPLGMVTDIKELEP